MDIQEVAVSKDFKQNDIRRCRRFLKLFSLGILTPRISYDESNDVHIE